MSSYLALRLHTLILTLGRPLYELYGLYEMYERSMSYMKRLPRQGLVPFSETSSFGEKGGGSWAWLVLAGRKAIPWLFTSFRDFEPP